MKVSHLQRVLLGSTLFCGFVSLSFAADPVLPSSRAWYSTNFGATQSSGVYSLLTNVPGASFEYTPGLYEDGIFSAEFDPKATGVFTAAAYIKGTEDSSTVINSALGMYAGTAVQNTTLTLENRLRTGTTHYSATGFTASFDYNVYSGGLQFGYLVDGATYDLGILTGSGTLNMSSYDLAGISDISYGENIQLYWKETSGSAWIDNLQVTAVPEPSTYALFLGVATLGLVGWRRFRRK